MQKITIPNEDLKPGDDLDVIGKFHRVLRIDPYTGPFRDEGCFGIAVWQGEKGEMGMSLWRGQRVTVVRSN